MHSNFPRILLKKQETWKFERMVSFQ